ncbi:MAG: hypothetical protein K6F63_05640 [Lachnospiraceae bacterium]|nr:hypothetical protein [Lachnospiraceae bacterium]
MSKTCLCRYCGKFFNSPVERTCCNDCQKIEEEEFDRIKDYLKRYPNSNAIQIAEGLEISPFDIIRFIDEGRLYVNRGEFKTIGGDKK